MTAPADVPEEAPVPEAVRERWRARRRAAVTLLRVLCALPALLVLRYALFPKVNYRTQVALAAPAARQDLDLGRVRVELRDRALALVAIDPAGGRDRPGLPRVVVRNNVRSAAVYDRLLHMERSGVVRATLRLPGPPGDLVLPQDSWQVDVTTTSDYTKQLGHRLGGLVAGLLLVGLAALLLPRLVYVLWPDRPT